MRSRTLDLIVPKRSLSVLLKEDMGRGYTVFARSLKRKSLCYYLAPPMVLALAGFVAVLIFAPEVKREDESKEVSVETSSAPSVFPPSFLLLIPSARDANRDSSHRSIYPYSIIPGGISSVEELKIAITHDPLVKAHYRGFNLAKAHIVRLTKDRAVHVSYRLGGGIYWTQKSIILLRGETLITDGRNASRTRCGNRISDRPAPPFSPDEPPPLVFDTPMVPPTFPSPPPYDAPLAPPPGGSVPILPIIPIFPGGGSSPPVIHKPPEPVPVPEPGTLCLLIATLPAAWLIRKKCYC